MTSSLHFVTYWLPSLLVISVCIWAICGGKIKPSEMKSPPSEKNFPPATFIPEVRQRGRATVWISLPVILLMGVAGGYAIRDHQLIANTFTYEGVTVNSKVSDSRYWVTIPGYTRQRDFEFCHSLKMPADVIDLKYEQRYGCKQVYGVGFVQPHKEKNNVESDLQNGRGSAT